MTDILRSRSRRFDALHAMLTGDVGLVHLRKGDLQNHLLRDVGLHVAIPHEGPVGHVGVSIHPEWPWRLPLKEGRFP